MITVTIKQLLLLRKAAVVMQEAHPEPWSEKRYSRGDHIDQIMGAPTEEDPYGTLICCDYPNEGGGPSEECMDWLMTFPPSVVIALIDQLIDLKRRGSSNTVKG